MNPGRTRISGPFTFNDKPYYLIVYYDSGYNRYSLQFVEGDWQPTVINVVAGAPISLTDQASYPDPKTLVLDRITAMNNILKNSVFAPPAPPAEDWVKNLETAILNLEIKLIDGVPQITVKPNLPI